MYREIDFVKVRGYDNLSKEGQALFEKVYKLHNSIQGTDYKEGYEPIKVSEEGNKLKVHFKNKDWLYYYSNGTWG